jgi:hypothetical protein
VSADLQKKQKRVPVRLRSERAFGFAERRFAQDDPARVECEVVVRRADRIPVKRDVYH